MRTLSLQATQWMSILKMELMSRTKSHDPPSRRTSCGRRGLADLTKDEQLARRSVNGAMGNPAALASGNAKMLARKREVDRLAAMPRAKSRGRVLAVGGMGR